LLCDDDDIAAEFGKAAEALGLPLAVGPLRRDWRAVYRSDAILLSPDRFIVWAGDRGMAPSDILAAAIGSAGPK